MLTKKLVSLLLFLGILNVVSAQTAGTLTITTTTSSTDVQYPLTGFNTVFGPMNATAFWIEDANGKFITTLKVLTKSRRAWLTEWTTKSAQNTVNATTGATMTNYGTVSCTWDGRDVTGAIVPDGTYKLRMELADDADVVNNDGGFTGVSSKFSASFTKGTTAVSITAPNVTSFSNNILQWIPAGNPVQTAGTLTIVTTTASTDPLDPTGGVSSASEYGPHNCVAIWIEDGAGKFVKTLTQWGITRKDVLFAWKASSVYNLSGLIVVAGRTPSLPQPDATTGATLTGYGKMSCTWDGKNTAGAIVADGEYKVRYELTDNGVGGIVRSMTVSFTKGPTAVTPIVGNATSFGSNSVKWTPVAIPPTTPTNLQTNSITASSFILNWTAPVDPSVIGYDVYKDGVYYGSTTIATTLAINGLSSGSNYSMTVKSKDAVGNILATSAILIVTTLDNTAPTSPTNLSATTPSIATGYFTLSWTASTDNIGVVNYYVYKDGVLCDATTSTTSNPIYILSAGSFNSFTVKAVDAAGNLSTASSSIMVASRFSPIEIGMVTNTNDNKNMVVWNKPITSGIASFYIYRESNVMNVYEKIGTVPYDSLSVFVDKQALPEAQSNKYKISIYGITGLESDQSNYHKTMHLSISKVIGTAWYLIWEPYEGFIVPTYNIYRGTTPNNLTLIASTSGSNTQFTDLSAPSGNVYYQLEVVNPNIVNPTKISGSDQKILAAENFVLQSYNSARSNIASYIISSVSTSNEVSFEVYPNPSNGLVTLSIANANGYSMVVSNSLGQKVYFSKLLTDKTIFDFSQFGKQGIYFVQITDEKGIVVGRKKVVVQ